MTNKIVIFVGEDNPYGGHAGYDEHALFPVPDRCAGHNLQSKILGLKRYTYMDESLIRRANVCGSGWSLTNARRNALSLLLGVPEGSEEARVDAFGRAELARTQDRLFVLMGQKVAQAFRFEGDFFTHQLATQAHPQMMFAGPVPRLLSLPHPSGRCTIWNSLEARTKARKLLAELAPQVPWGEDFVSSRN